MVRGKDLMDGDVNLSRADLPRVTRACLRAGGGTRPQLALLDIGGREAVLKDYRASGWLMRCWLGPWLIGREERIYQHLEGLPGVPRLICRLDRHALVVERIRGRSCAEFPDGSLPPAFFERLREVVEGMHARGVVHCDLKNRSNIVVGEDGEPYIVDFASAFCRGGRWFPLRRFLFEQFRRDDLRAVAKAKILVSRVYTSEEAEFAFRRGLAERLVRAARDAARWLFRLVVGK